MLPAAEDNSISEIFQRCASTKLYKKCERILMTCFLSLQCVGKRGIFHMCMIEKIYISKQ